MAQDEYLIDKARVRAAFDRAATQYDGAAILQKTVREEMLSRLALMTIQPEQILDIGCGTGHGSIALQQYYPKAQVFSLDIAMRMLKETHKNQPFKQKLFKKKRLICADAEMLPSQSDAIDFVWSNLAIQWCNDLDQVFAEIKRVMRPNGLLMFSTFGPDTLKELRVASGSDHTHVSRFIDMHDIGDALTRAGFSAPVLDVVRYTLTYDDVIAVMKDLKTIGAANATAGRAKGLMGQGFIKHMTAAYEQFRQQDGKLPATFEVVYGHAWQPEESNLPEGVSPIEFKPRQS